MTEYTLMIQFVLNEAAKAGINEFIGKLLFGEDAYAKAFEWQAKMAAHRKTRPPRLDSFSGIGYSKILEELEDSAPIPHCIPDYTNDNFSTQLLHECADKNISLIIHNYAESLEIEDRGYRVTCLWGDSNCHHKKPYDQTDGHGFTQFSVEAATFGLAIAGTFAIAHGWRP